MPCPKVVSRERSRRQKGDKCLYKDRANPTGKVTEGASYTDSILKGDTVRYQNISWCKGIVCKVTSNFLNCSGIWTYLEKMETVILFVIFFAYPLIFTISKIIWLLRVAGVKTLPMKQETCYSSKPGEFIILHGNSMLLTELLYY